MARVRTNRAGKYLATRLRPGVYNVQVEPPAGSGLSRNELCFVVVRAGRNRLDLLLWPGPGPDPIPGDST